MAQTAHNAALVSGTVTVTRTGGGAVTLTEIPVSGAVGGVFTGTGGTFSGQLSMTAPDGDKTFVAGWTGPGPSRTLTIVRDTLPPGVTVEVEPRPVSLGDTDVDGGNGWKKDEWALVKVVVDGGLAAAVANLKSAWDGGVRTASGCSACGSACGCFEVDLAGSTVAGLRGTVGLRVDGISDSAGNPAPPVNASIPVTRLKWVRTMSLAAGSTPVLPIAVSPTGVVVWGAAESSSSSSRVLAVGQDGGSFWSAVTVGTVTAGPAIASNGVWVATDDGTNSQLVRQAGTAATECIATTMGAGTFTGDLALTSAETPIGVRSGQVRVGDGSCGFLALPDAGSLTSLPHVVVQTVGANVEAFVAYEGRTQLWKQTLASQSWTGNGWATLPSGTQPRGLFLDGTSYVGGGGVVGNGAVFATSATGTLSGQITVSVPASNAGAPVLGPDFVLWGDTDGNLVKAPFTAGVFGGTTTQATGLGDLQASMPVLGHGQRAYIVGSTGTLSVRRTSDLSEEWSGSLVSLTGGGNVSQLALDSYRGAAGRDCTRKLGVLYVTTRTGSVASLRAVIVDSPGLQPMARWPKFQRDNANTGNGSSDLMPWTCP